MVEREGYGGGQGEWVGEGRYRLSMSETISTSVSAAASFSAEEGWGRPAPKRYDIVFDVLVDLVVGTLILREPVNCSSNKSIS